MVVEFGRIFPDDIRQWIQEQVDAAEAGEDRFGLLVMPSGDPGKERAS